MTIDLLGWVATAVFTASYFCKRPEALRRTQMLGAALWAAYGVLVHAAPVVVANALLLVAAAVTAARARAAAPAPAARAGAAGPQFAQGDAR